MSSVTGCGGKGGSPPPKWRTNMENINGDAGPSIGLESANSSSAAADLPVLQILNPLVFAETCIERAQDLLRYGRRQEAEEAIKHLDEARFGIQAARAPREG